MSLSLKCQYAVRALFELARRRNDGLIRLREIAAAQHIPERFLENILNELRQAGFVASKRGKDGGFRLNREPDAITIGDVVRFVEGSVHPVDCVADRRCPMDGACIFIGLWDEAQKAVEQVYDNKKLADLVREDAQHHRCAPPSTADAGEAPAPFLSLPAGEASA
ncbi:MAG: Rrf2 family transcriptional regulator [Planctomycetes bacterium]|nr:Rrf2 family transcriptional regulator [Planctomycetota bacterium]